MTRALLPILFSLLACGPKAPSRTTLEATPRLPAPRAAAYASVESTPSDPVVARLVRGRKWNETLSGAAAGLALEWTNGQGDLAAWEVREAAWQAGWPWPVLEVRGWITPPAGEPPQELMQWLDGLEAGDSLGLVRARGVKGDAWVALRAHPRGELPIQPRQVEIGGQLAFTPQPGVKLTVADPVGSVTTVSLERERVTHVDVAGEWLFELKDDQGTLALFPVYAAMVPPETPVLEERARPLSAEEAVTGFAELLGQIREIYGQPPYRTDVLLQSAARSLRDKKSSSAEIARTLGYAPETTWKISCRARTLADCADKLLWNPRVRPALLTTDADLGLNAQLVPDGVHVVVLVAAR